MRTGAFAAALLIASFAFAQTTQNHPYISAEQSNAIANEWTRPMEPFKILGNLYYVGSQNIGSYLFITPQGDILLDTGMPSMLTILVQPFAGTLDYAPLVSPKRPNAQC